MFIHSLISLRIEMVLCIQKAILNYNNNNDNILEIFCKKIIHYKRNNEAILMRFTKIKTEKIHFLH